METREIIKLNNNDNHLSLGNLFRVIKENSINPTSFLQTDLFEAIYNCNNVGISTINNYCTGIRKINPDYKDYMLNQKNKYQNNKQIFIPTISKILNLLNEGKIFDDIWNLKDINENIKLKNICQKLYSISKNDKDVSFDISSKLYSLLEKNNLYSFIVEVIFFVTLDKNQPIYKINVIDDVIESNVANTNISINDVEKFINLQLNAGLWSLRELNNLVLENNPLACFEMGSLEFYGLITGKPRYNVAYKLFNIASKQNHPVAIWALGYLYYNGYIGNKSKEDINKAIEYFNKAKDLNCSNAYNSLGLVYKDDNLDKAFEYFTLASEANNPYAFNNLGIIFEENKNFEKAYNNFYSSALLGNSWALNKIGEYYRNGIFIKKDLKKAYEYYLKASECPYYYASKWSKYNLAKYFYLNGCIEADIEKDIRKAIELFDSISDNIMACEELIYIYYDLYISNNKSKKYYNELMSYMSKIESNKDYNNCVKNRIEKKIKKLFEENINIDNYI